MDEVRVRPIEAGGKDADAVERVCREAFPEEDLVPLVRRLLTDAATIATLVAVADASVVGVVIFTRCAVDGVDVALLGPLAVAPSRQRQGVGDALVRQGLSMLEGEAVRAACVLGDPRYYARFDFRPEVGIVPPFPLPPAWNDAWRSRLVGRAPGEPPTGTLRVPRPWDDPTLWGPCSSG